MNEREIISIHFNLQHPSNSTRENGILPPITLVRSRIPLLPRHTKGSSKFPKRLTFSILNRPQTIRPDQLKPSAAIMVQSSYRLVILDTQIQTADYILHTIPQSWIVIVIWCVRLSRHLKEMYHACRHWIGSWLGGLPPIWTRLKSLAVTRRRHW